MDFLEKLIYLIFDKKFDLFTQSNNNIINIITTFVNDILKKNEDITYIVRLKNLLFSINKLNQTHLNKNIFQNIFTFYFEESNIQYEQKELNDLNKQITILSDYIYNSQIDIQSITNDIKKIILFLICQKYDVIQLNNLNITFNIITYLQLINKLISLYITNIDLETVTNIPNIIISICICIVIIHYYNHLFNEEICYLFYLLIIKLLQLILKDTITTDNLKSFYDEINKLYLIINNVDDNPSFNIIIIKSIYLYMESLTDTFKI